MATFPKLKTGAVLQYPATRHLKYASEVVRFVDGAEQAYRDWPSALRQWVVQLELLDEAEMSEIEGFFRSVQGRSGSFVFADPWTGVEYPDCSLVNDVLNSDFAAESQGGTALVVRENRR